MSRVGANPIPIPEGVTINFDGGNRMVSVKGKNGEISKPLPPRVDLDIGDGAATLKPHGEGKETRAMWGTARSLLADMVTGVSEGFTRNLTIHGVGYRAQMKGSSLVLSLGLSHPVEMELPDGVKCAVENNTEIKLTGHDKQVLGQFAAEIRRKRPPEPYKGKGIRYEDEQILRKEGKKK